MAGKSLSQIRSSQSSPDITLDDLMYLVDGTISKAITVGELTNYLFKSGITLGDSTNKNIDIVASQAENSPRLRYSVSTNSWQFSNDGTTFTDIGDSSLNLTVSEFLTLSPDGELDLSNSVKSKLDQIQTDYTAFEVYATDAIIPANETYAVDVPAGMTETFKVRSDNPQNDNDVVVDWGDNTRTLITELTAENINLVADADTEEISFIFSHTYTTPGKYIVKILGKNYWGLQHTTGSTTNIICRILDYDLPIASCVQNISGFCQNNYKLVGVNVPTGQQFFTNIHNASMIFANCKNLVYANNFETKFRFTRTIATAFRDCSALKYADLKLPVLTTYKNTSCIGVYDGCTNLGSTWTNLAGVETRILIEDLIPAQGFCSREIQLNSCFKNCRSLTGTIPATYLWQDTTIAFVPTDCFTGCSASLRSQAPVSWGGTDANLDILINAHYWNCVPTASTQTIGGVKIDGTSITINNGVISAVAGGGSGGSSVGINNLKLDNVSTALGNFNTIGGYSVRVTKYVASATQGQSYVEVSTLYNEGDDFDAPTTSNTNSNSNSVDWDKLTVGTTIYYVFANLEDNTPIADEIDHIDQTNSRIYLKNKLVTTTYNYNQGTGNYVTRTVYYSGALNSNGSGDLVYSELTEGTDWTAGTAIGSGVYTRSVTNTDISEDSEVGNIGDCVVVPFLTRGSNEASFSVGYSNASVGNLSTSVGAYNYNAGLSSIVGGINNCNTAEFSMLFGFNNLNDGSSSLLLGSTNRTDVESSQCISIGSSNDCIKKLLDDGQTSVSQSAINIGSMNKSYSVNTLNIGLNNEAYAYGAINVGNRSKIYGKNAMTFGYDLEVREDGCILIGNRGVVPKKIDWVATDQTKRKYYKDSIVISSSEGENSENIFEITSQNYWCNPNYSSTVTSGSNMEQYFYEDDKVMWINPNYRVDAGNLLITKVTKKSLSLPVSNEASLVFDFDLSSYFIVNVSSYSANVIPSILNAQDGQEVLVKFIGDISNISFPASWGTIPATHGTLYNVIRLIAVTYGNDTDYYMEFVGGR